MREEAMTGRELGDKLLIAARRMKVGIAVSRIRDYGAKALSERAPGVINPSEAEMNAILNGLRS